MSQEAVIEKINHLPDEPGIYLFKDAQDDVIYVGKAKSLKKRVKSYFLNRAQHGIRIRIMVSLVRDVDTVLTNKETEALILEDRYIKQYQPRYNVKLKDDKSYPYFKLSTNEMYPRLLFVREKLDKRAEYFGPYTSARDARQVLRLINRQFQLRTSKMKLDGTRTYRPCINFQLKRCLAPCRGNVPVEEYQEVVDQVRYFLQGRSDDLLKALDARMQRYAEQLEFELAAQVRDQAQALRRIFERQRVFGPSMVDQDVFATCREADRAGVQVLFIRGGRVLASDFFYFDKAEQVSEDNLLGQVLNRIYGNENYIVPQQVLLPFEYSDQEPLAEMLRERAGKLVAVQVPKRGEKRQLIEMAMQNALSNFQEKQRLTVRDEEILNEVQKTLRLRFLPQLVECFDISNIQGTDTVASLVAFKNNRPFKEGYRKYKIRTVEGPNDFASMREVLTRRYQRTLKGEFPMPNLILIDGGKGQLSMAVKVLEELGVSLEEVDLIGLAKGRSERRRGVERDNEEDFEYVVKPNMKNEIRLHRTSPVLFFLTCIRDETHRFAITFHREQRRKRTLTSSLEQIPGVGEGRRKALLKHFGSLKRLKEATVEDITQCPGISDHLAQVIHQHLNAES